MTISSVSNSDPAQPHKIWTCSGGIHLPTEKDHTLGRLKSYRSAGLPALLVLPLHQHASTAVKLCVARGDRVLAGQMLAKPGNLTDASLHAPTSGTIRGIEDWPTFYATRPVPCLILEPDGAHRWVDREPIPNWIDQSPTTLIKRLSSAGISAINFSTAMNSAGDQKGRLHTLIVNGLECESYISSDEANMLYRPEAIIIGARLLMHMTGAQEGLIAFAANMPKVAETLQSALINEGDPRLKIVPLPARYPLGNEKLLVRLLTGQEVPDNALPTDLGVLCQDIATTIAVQRAIVLGEPFVSRITTVAGRAVDAPGNFLVRLGTPLIHLLRAARLNEQTVARLVMGGSIRGLPLKDAFLPVGKTTNCIIAATAAEFPKPAPEQPCIRCGKCEVVCPVGLQPQQIYRFARSQDLVKVRDYRITDCIECNACAYVCPSAIPLVQHFRETREAIHNQDADALRANLARERFEHRQARIAASQAERTMQKQARIAAAISGSEEAQDTTEAQRTARVSIVEAALARADKQPESHASAQPASHSGMATATAHPTDGFDSTQQGIGELEDQDDDATGDLIVPLPAGAPHVPGPLSTGSVMRTVALACLPGLLTLVWFFGASLIANLVIAVAATLTAEAVCLGLRRRPITPALCDSSAMLTGLILGLALPPFLPWWMTLLGATFAIILGKQIYGGIGQNPFNPAMLGYAALLVSFPVEMSTWAPPHADIPLRDALAVIFTGNPPADAFTGATPLDSFKFRGALTSAEWHLQSGLGGDFSSLGWEWVNLAFLIGGLWLLKQRLFTWHAPVAMLVSLALLSVCFWDGGSSDSRGSPLHHLFSGATMFGAFFIVTEPVSSAASQRGRLIFGAGVGVLVYLIRAFGSYPDALAFAVLLMNLAAPYIDECTRPRSYSRGSTSSRSVD